MSTLVNATLPVSNIEHSVAFYTSLGFKQNKELSMAEVKMMVWNDHFWLLLMSSPFFKKIIREKKIATTSETCSAIISFYVDSPEEVKRLAEIAKKNGGDYYFVDLGVPEDQIYCLEILDPDGNLLEMVWMKM